MLRVVVAYTPRVAASVADIKSIIDLAIAETNESYTNSGVKINAELAYAYQVNYQESGSHDTDLRNFRTPNDSVMDEVHALRGRVQSGCLRAANRQPLVLWAGLSDPRGREHCVCRGSLHVRYWVLFISA